VLCLRGRAASVPAPGSAAAAHGPQPLGQQPLRSRWCHRPSRPRPSN